MTTHPQEAVRALKSEGAIVIDADAHVVECESTWDYLDAAEARLRPTLEADPDDPDQKFWSVAGKRLGFRFPALTVEALRTRSERTGRRFEIQTSQVDDIDLRLQIMTETGIDLQVCHNTLWIERVADDPEVDVAMCRSWNRWLADKSQRAGGRIRWTCVVPTLNIEEAIKQAKFAKANGAVGVCLRPLEADRIVTDPYFYPIFEAAQDLDMAIAIHIANGSPENVALWRGALGGLGAFRAPAVLACAAYLLSPIHETFPRLRWGFIEASAQWLPWIVREVKQRFIERGSKFPENILDEYNVFVTCQNDDDVPYLIKGGLLGGLVIGTDFGHFDPSSDIDAITKFLDNDELSDGDKEQILYHNPKALYGL